MNDLKKAWRSLSNPDIWGAMTVRDYDLAVAAVNGRVRAIWKYIIFKSDRYLESSELNERFDRDEYINTVTAKIDESKVTIDQHKNFSMFETSTGSHETRDWYSDINSHYPYADGFPTELMWDENWSSIIDEKIDEAVKTFIDQRLAKLARNKVKKQEKAIKDKAARNKDRALMESVLAKVKTNDGDYILDEEEYNFLVRNLISR